MIVKSHYARVSRVSQKKASSALASHFKYLQYRERDPLTEAKSDRQVFDERHDHVDRRAAHRSLMGEEPAGDIYYHRMVLSPAHDEPVEDLRAWTRAVMEDLEERKGLELDWYAVQHRNTDEPHVHVVIGGTGIGHETGSEEAVRFSRDDFQAMRESGRDHSDYEHYHLIRDTLPQETPTHEHERLLEQER